MASPTEGTTMIPPSPFHIDPKTNEPYIPLPAPWGPKIRLTPPRLSDADCLVTHFNDPRVYPNLTGPPYPFTQEHGTGAITKWMESSNMLWKQVLNGKKCVGGCPVRIIRERVVDQEGNETGEDIFLGDVMVARSKFVEIADDEERERKAEENAKLEDGDENIVWTIGDFLAPSHHNRGIMSKAIEAVLDFAFRKEYMNAKRFVVTAYSHNIGSQRTLEKNGFKFNEEVKDRVDLSKLVGRGEGRVSIKVFERVEA
ncbi:hypothetical protein FRC02_006975 [Tulasnella sp. 418]|nr:hypothetical protein FRC02_006975 [Tulasnella sp. 418]